MKQTDDAPVIPLWLAGHAYLTLTPAFFDVCDARDGSVLRRTPLCGEDEARQAVAAASAALPGWQALSDAARGVLLAALADALTGYAAHFAQLIVEEAGGDDELARAEVDAAVALLRAPPWGDEHGVLAVVGACQASLLAVVRVAAAALRAGAALIVRPAPQCPSAVLALAELSARCAFPPGVFNVLHGDTLAVDALHACGIAVRQA